MALMPVAEALENILAGVMPLGPEQVGLRFAQRRDTRAHRLRSAHHPPFDASAMDGYAVRASDLKTYPATLRVIGEAPPAGHSAARSAAGEAVRIFTGAPVPDGADTVVIQEDVPLSDGKTVTITSARQPRATTSGCAARISTKATLFSSAAKLLNAREILLAAASGHGMLAVVKRPVVAILATGDELVEPSDRPAPARSYRRTPTAWRRWSKRRAAQPKMLGIAQDTR